MPTSKHQATVATLRHRQQEAYDAAAARCIKFIRNRCEDRGELIDAVRAVAELDAIAHDLALAEVAAAGKRRPKG